MKLLLIDSYIHDKNKNALCKYENLQLTAVSPDNLDNINLNNFDCVYSPSMPINVNKYPNTKFIFGPHFSVFPVTQQMNIIRGKNSVYIQPSEWVVKLWETNPVCSNIKLRHLPFGVDTDKFNDIKPISDRDRVFIYYKSRNPDELKLLCNFLKNRNVSYVIFSYNNRYNEDDYIKYLQNSRYGIWLGRHESQGFALEEALSCNVPLLVWDVKSMNQEYGQSYDNIPGTAIPYWDSRCGESFYTINELENSFNIFVSNLDSYKPREYVMENLSFKKCDEQLTDLINSI